MRQLETKDLILRPADRAFAEPLLAYYRRNKSFLEEFEPKREPSFYTYKEQYEQLCRESLEAENKTAFRFYLSARENTETIIGSIGVSQIVRGCFLSCYLGYKLDRGYLNRGYMTQAVRAVTEFAFADLGLHRIEGNVMPRNEASQRVLIKCGFQEEGLSRKYLRINGRWEDHIHMVILNERMA